MSESHFRFADLPPELQLGIMALLDQKSLAQISVVDRTRHDLAKDSVLWKRKLKSTKHQFKSCKDRLGNGTSFGEYLALFDRFTITVQAGYQIAGAWPECERLFQNIRILLDNQLGYLKGALAEATYPEMEDSILNIIARTTSLVAALPVSPAPPPSPGGPEAATGTFEETVQWFVTPGTLDWMKDVEWEEDGKLG